MPVYELFCLARPQLAKEQLASLIKTACTSVFTNNGVLTEVQSYDLRDLAYPIRKAGSKYEQAMMWQMQFLVKPEALPEIHRDLHINEDVLRWIVTKKRQHPVMLNTHSVSKAAQRLLDRRGMARPTSAEQHVAPH
ncbi:28S ribosomal protein S6, mitochondrial [Trebouxia sp. C0009 RCD-2024]